MNKKVWILLLVLVVLMAGAAFAYNTLADDVRLDDLAAGETKADAVNKNLAPDFTVYDLEGNAHSLSDFRGKPVIVNFWASWCGPCKREMPDFEEKFREYGEEIQFLMVNLTDGSRETVESARDFIDGQGYTFPIYFDTTYSAAMAYGVSGVPVTYFIDAEGNLVAWGQGALNAQALAQGIGMILPE